MSSDSCATVQYERAVFECRRILKELGRVVVAFSAGVDSTCLLALAVDELGSDNVLAVIGVSPSLAERELSEGRQLADRIGVELTEVVTHELDNPSYSANPAERCYFCKRELFSRLREVSAARGFDVILSGANADDQGDFRPGLRAGDELGVRCPMLEAGLTKSHVRRLSKELGLPTWDKPAMACLASRVPYGQSITAEVLERVEKAEGVLKDLGFRACRVRCHGTVARIEVPGDDLEALLQHRATVVPSLRKVGFHYVCMDLQGLRSGSMNEVLDRREG